MVTAGHCWWFSHCVVVLFPALTSLSGWSLTEIRILGIKVDFIRVVSLAFRDIHFAGALWSNQRGKKCPHGSWKCESGRCQQTTVTGQVQPDCELRISNFNIYMVENYHKKNSTLWHLSMHEYETWISEPTNKVLLEYSQWHSSLYILSAAAFAGLR